MIKLPYAQHSSKAFVNKDFVYQNYGNCGFLSLAPMQQDGVHIHVGDLEFCFNKPIILNNVVLKLDYVNPFSGEFFQYDTRHGNDVILGFYFYIQFELVMIIPLGPEDFYLVI